MISDADRVTHMLDAIAKLLQQDALLERALNLGRCLHLGINGDRVPIMV